MAAVSLNYLQIGPRQGVHISPVRWRQTQFRAPEASYQFRARVEPHPATTGLGFPARIVRRQIPPKHAAGGSLALSISRSNPSPTSPKKCPQLLHRQPSERGKEGAGLAFSLTAQAVVMKPRPPQRPPPAVRASGVPTSQQPFSYPDPAKIKGNPSFDLRLIELAKLESDTIKYEEFRSRMLSHSNRPSSPCDRLLTRPSSARSAPPPKARPQSSPRASLAGTDRERRLGTAPLLHRKTSCPTTLSTSANSSRPVSLYGTIRESRSATPTTQRAVSKSHLSPSKSDRTSTCTLNPSNRRQTSSCSPETESEKSQSPGSPSNIPATDCSAPLQEHHNESTVATQTTDTRTYPECSSPLPSQAELGDYTNCLAACWKLTEGQSYSPKVTIKVSKTSAETVRVGEGSLCVCSITDLDLLPGQEEGISSSSQKSVETNERATQTMASTTKRKGLRTHSTKKIPLSKELIRSHSSPRLDNQLLDSSSECSLKSTKSKKNRSHTSRKLHNTHTSRRTK